MASKTASGIRPSLERKLVEFLNRSKEFYAFKNLDHPYLLSAYRAGWEDAREYLLGDRDKLFQEWRNQFDKEEQEKHKRTRST